MKIAIDTHTHTLMSGHAYSTMREMVQMAEQMSMPGLAITEHAPNMPGSCNLFYFQNLRVVPRTMCGVEVLLGVELNIMNESGEIDLPESLLKEMDLVIGSIHTPCYAGEREPERLTKAYVNAMKNPLINIIGHPDDARFPIDYELLVKTAGETGTLLEVNNSSMRPGGFRQDARGNIEKMLTLCKQYGVPIVIGSDAHVDADVGNVALAMEVIEHCKFPEELVANTSLEKLKSFL